ncbi:hypothetical protein [Nitrosopumilus sp.]|uniref:hypothetical protein n=1 Tax=Nitrosopumilus sp. TaxID=2024843 RepID=UPI002636430B|nr:hypothetical protein [Nitrosopumilus sp.]
MSEKPEDKKEGIDWTPEKIEAVFSGIGILAEKYLSFRDNNSKHETDAIQLTAKHDRKIVALLLAFLGSVIIAMSVLVAFDKVSGEALLFAVGLTIGYVFALITKFIFGARSDTVEQE